MSDDNPVESVLSETARLVAISRTVTVLRALAHDQRLGIIGLIAGCEKSVGEIERLMGVSQPAVSQQLARLRQDDLVKMRRLGRTIYYSANVEVLSGAVDHVQRLVKGGGARQACEVEPAPGPDVVPPVVDPDAPQVRPR